MLIAYLGAKPVGLSSLSPFHHVAEKLCNNTDFLLFQNDLFRFDSESARRVSRNQYQSE